MKITRFTFNPFGENTYILWNDDNQDAIIVDPGMSNNQECEEIDNFIIDNKITLTRMIFTHLHIDHAIGAKHLIEKYNLKVEAAKEEEILGLKLPEMSIKFGLNISNVTPLVTDKYLKEGDKINLGSESIDVIAVPGHSPNGLAFYCSTSCILIPGDILFNGSVGRSDLIGGNYNILISNIKSKLLVLPEETVVYPGHGPSTTISDEKYYNPYLS